VGPRAVPHVPAVVVGGTLNALGVVRSLSRGKMPIYLLETTRQCAGGWSSHSEYVAVAALGGRGLIDALIKLGRRLACRPVLILTSDESVSCVSERRQEIEPLFRISLPSREMVRALADKTLFQELAEREGFVVPRAVCVNDVASLELIRTLQLPLIMKPADKTLVLRGIVERAVRVDTLAEARRRGVQMLACAPRLIVQEWIDGPDTELFFTLFSCDGEGRLLGLFPGRKLLCYPPAIGSTAVCVAAPEVAGELLAPTLEFIRRVGYRGLGSLEFKRDLNSGRFVIIEPTVGRTDWQEEIATVCGVNLPLRTYQGELGMPQETDGSCFPQVAWCTSASFRAPLACGMRTVDGFFRWSDPLPALYHYGYERVLMRLWSRLSGAPAPLAGSLAGRKQ
jgi:D-aspartate ligase